MRPADGLGQTISEQAFFTTDEGILLSGSLPDFKSSL